MTTQTAETETQKPSFSPRERQALRKLRGRYAENLHLFSHEEIARLEFLRWLSRSGGLEA